MERQPAWWPNSFTRAAWRGRYPQGAAPWHAWQRGGQVFLLCGCLFANEKSPEIVKIFFSLKKKTTQHFLFFDLSPFSWDLSFTNSMRRFGIDTRQAADRSAAALRRQVNASECGSRHDWGTAVRSAGACRACVNLSCARAPLTNDRWARQAMCAGASAGPAALQRRCGHHIVHPNGNAATAIEDPRSPASSATGRGHSTRGV